MGLECGFEAALIGKDRGLKSDVVCEPTCRCLQAATPIGLLPEQYASMKEARRGIFGHFGIPLAMSLNL